MTTLKKAEIKLYEVISRSTGERLLKAATSAEDACKSACLLIGDCYVHEAEGRLRKNDEGHSRTMVKLSCQVCCYQYAECLKPDGIECPARSNVPDWKAWIKTVLRAHQCPHTGVELAIKDHELHQKWLPIDQAIKELSAK